MPTRIYALPGVLVVALGLLPGTTFAQNAATPAPGPSNTAIPAARPAPANAATQQAKPAAPAPQPPSTPPKTTEPTKAPPTPAPKAADAKPVTNTTTPQTTPDAQQEKTPEATPEEAPKKKAGAQALPCVVADFRAIGIDTQDAEKRRVRALAWIAQRGKQCTAQQLLVMRNNRSQWLGNGDSGAVAASIDSLLEVFAETNPDIALLLYGTPPPPPPPPDPKAKKPPAK